MNPATRWATLTGDVHHNALSIREWLDRNHVRNVRVLAVPVGPEQEDPIPHPPADIVRLTTWLDDSTPDRGRTLLARLVRDLGFVDPRRVCAVALADQRRLFFTLEIWCYAPEELLTSAPAARALAGHTELSRALREDVSSALFEALEAYTTSMPEFAARIGALLRDHLAPRTHTHEQEKIDAFLSHLDLETRRLIEDCRLLSHLSYRAIDTLRLLDDWAHHDRQDPASSDVRGIRFVATPLGHREHAASITYPPAIVMRASQPRAPDPDELAASIVAPATPRDRKSAALRALEALPRTPETEAILIRLAAEPSVQIDCLRLLPGIAVARPLVDELVFTEDTRRVVHALAELVGYGKRLAEPLQAWERAGRSRRRPHLQPELGPLFQSVLLDGIRDADEAFLARLATELGRERRSDDWLMSGLTVLERFDAPQARGVARILIRHTNPDVRSWAHLMLEAVERRTANTSGPHEELDDADVHGADAASTLNKRLALWRKPGYAWWRYCRDGHRNPRWDAAVERAYAAFEPNRKRQPREVRDGLREAVDAGCRDAVVYYRLGVAAAGEEDDAAARRWFEDALPLFERYPDNPYRSAAAEHLGNWHRGMQHHQRALYFLRMAYRSGQYSPSTRSVIVELEDEQEALTDAAEQRESLSTGELIPFPSATHQAAVTALQVAPGADYMVSADASGLVVLSFLGRADVPRVIPVDGWQAHPAGRTMSMWVTGDRILTTGADCMLRSARIADDLLRDLGNVGSLAAPASALQRLQDGRLAIATEAGTLTLWDPSSVESFDLPRIGPEDVLVELRSSARWLLARTARGDLELFDLGRHPGPRWRRPHEGYPLAFAEIIDEETAMIGNDQGLAWHLHLESGRLSEVAQQLPFRPPPIEVRFDARRGVSVWGNASGSIRIERTAPAAGHVLVTNSLARLDVSFEHGTLVHVDTARRLGCHFFDPGRG